MQQRPPSPSLALSLAPIGFLMAMLAANVHLFGDEATGGANQLALFLTAAFAALLGRYALGMDYRQMEMRAIHSIGLAMQANLILLVVGILIGIWILAGIVPTLIYYGIVLINPSVFFLVACVACSMVSITIGSSWSTMGTIGIALIGAGEALQLPPAMVAGAIVSGAYFGDKLSPLSETTNLAPAVADSELFTHIRHMLYTTVPAYALTLAGYTVLGLFFHSGAYDAKEVNEVLAVVRSSFSIGPRTLITPVIVVLLVLLRMPALPALVVGALLGAAQALLLQTHLFTSPNGDFSWTAAYAKLIETAHSGYTMESGNEFIDKLFSRGGMLGMLNTVLLILMAMLFGGVMEATGMLRRIAEAILHLVRGTGSLVAATISSCILFNLTASDQYLSIVVPGRMFREAYAERGLDPRNLSRALEDGGTVTSVLVPWNTCGAFAAGVLLVPTVSYLPYAFFCLLCPVVSVSMAAMNMTIVRLKPEEREAAE